MFGGWEYASDKYRVVPGWFGPVLQVWMDYPNVDCRCWKRIPFSKCHTLLRGEHK